MMVVVYHYISWRFDGKLWGQLSSIVFNGADAVSFFFVLSGFVLSYKYVVLKHSLDLRKYAVNRFFRLWPAFFLTVLINALYWYKGDLSLHNLIDKFIFNGDSFWEEASLIRYYARYFGPAWTLILEFCFSLMLPFIIAMGQRNKKLIPWLVGYWLLAGGVLNTASLFGLHFTLGLILSFYYTKITDPGFKATKWYRYRSVFLLVAAFLFSTRILARISPPGPSYTYFFETYLGYNYFTYSAFGSFIFLVFIVHSRQVQKVLEFSLFRFIGRISYSIYLMHWCFVKGIFDYWDTINNYFPSEKATFLIVFIPYVTATLLAATLVHYFVERPGLALGKRIVKRLKPSFVIEPV